MNKELSLVQALAWIVASLFIVTGGTFATVQHLRQSKKKVIYEPMISSLVQTGPQKQALTTDYLVELLGLSADRPCRVKSFKVKEAEEALLQSPLISQAKVRLLKPGTVYVDYTVRQPIAWLEDYENVAIDKNGYPFPLTPFFSPKNLPAFYLGLPPFGATSTEPDKPEVQWRKPLQGKLIELSFAILDYVSDPAICDQFSIKRIDVSNALAPSYGSREIVVITEDTFTQHIKGKDVEFHQSRLLRLNVKNLAQELGNYLSLRRNLLEEEQKKLAALSFTETVVHLPEKVLDFRIDLLAFIRE